MYRSISCAELSFENFNRLLGGKLSSENRWVKLAQMIPWKAFEPEYAAQMNEDIGAPGKSFRTALGALLIKERLGTSDEETVEQIRENPYLQYFLGLSEYSDTAAFDSSSMVHFRKRISLEMVGRINQQVSVGSKKPDNAPSLNPVSASDEDNDDDTNDGNGEQGEEPANQGQLIVDASCAPADIRYPTDLNLLNAAREQTETIIDELYKQIKDELQQKPRTYRRQARQQYLQVAKQRKANRKTIRKAIGKQLGYLRRNLAHIDALLAAGASLSQLSLRLYRNLLVVCEVFRQQTWMYENRQHRIEDRIVSLSQPHVRPIVRGKAGTPVEFGAKFSASCVNGFVFLDELSWDNFNEGGNLPDQIEQFRDRFGHYPDSVHADQIYRTRFNRAYAQERGIRLSGPPLGRPAIKTQAAVRRQTLDDARVRNHIEGKFGQGKRRFSLARIMAKLAQTAQTTIAISFLAMNLERLLKQLLFGLLPFFVWCGHPIQVNWRKLTTIKSLSGCCVILNAQIKYLNPLIQTFSASPK
jgi:transposase, IS5 family